MSQSQSVEASLNYLAPMTDKPEYYLYEPPPEIERHTPETAPHTVSIFDGRVRGVRLLKRRVSNLPTSGDVLMRSA